MSEFTLSASEVSLILLGIMFERKDIMCGLMLTDDYFDDSQTPATLI